MVVPLDKGSNFDIEDLLKVFGLSEVVEPSELE